MSEEIKSRRIIANNISFARESIGYSQSKLAHYLGSSYHDVWRIETAKKDLPLEFAYKLAKLFKLSIEDLITKEYSIERKLNSR